MPSGARDRPGRMAERLASRLRLVTADRTNNARLRRLTREVQKNALPARGQAPVVFFNASSAVHRLSLNRAYTLLASWSLRLQGIPVAYFVCRQGMTYCAMGTNSKDVHVPPPCYTCVPQSERMYAHSVPHWFRYQEEDELARLVVDLDVPALKEFEFHGTPLGRIAFPSICWILRRYNLIDDKPTRYLYREYILSTWSVGQEFERLVDEVKPQTLVLFNGMFYPEAMARRSALQRGIRVVTHEVGLRPFTAFFTSGEATAYPIDIPSDFELSPEQDQCLDQYLEQRFQGNFSMAGIYFWPQMRSLDEGFQQLAGGFKYIVPVFTNVIFDTSQPHSNVVFADMYAWLDEILATIPHHPETLFVLRAHPDEKRPGKESQESVSDWVEQRRALLMPNLVFYDSNEYVSSYELIQRSKFVLVYNSSIGLEASIMGAAVLCAGKARYTQYPTVFFEPTREAYHTLLEEFLVADKVSPHSEHRRNARRFLYYQLFCTSLPFEQFLEPHPFPGFVLMRSFPWQQLLPENSPALNTITHGLTEGRPFLMEEGC
jgi:hypothetical protein